MRIYKWTSTDLKTFSSCLCFR